MNITELKKHLSIVLLFISPTFIMANMTAKEYFNEKAYEKAFPLVEVEAKGGAKASMYRLAYMYQNGLGIKKDIEKAAYWFQQSASSYEYTLTMDSKEDEQKKSFLIKLNNQMDPSINKESHSNTVDMIDTTTPETKSFANYLLGDDYFGLLPYRSNYFLPTSYSTHKYERIQSGKHKNNYSVTEKEKYGIYNSNTEVEFQISLKKPLTYNLFGMNENITITYTQKTWWQFYSDSTPFRETNYFPELYISIPTNNMPADEYGLKSVKFAFLHQSNGQEGYRSRSWNRIYAAANTQWDNLFISTRVWYRLPEEKKYSGYYDGLADENGEIDPNTSGDDNPDIENYMGYGDLKVNYLYKKHEFGGLFRYNFAMGGTNRGAIDLHWTHPFFDSKNTFFYLKFFNGYGESLIDYNNCVTKTAFGFSLSRGVF